MGVHSDVEGIPEPYDPQFKLWDEARTYRLGDEVPEVGMASTYAVRINAPPGEPARFLTVQEGKITNLMAHQPVYGKSVFDKWGAYLGRGGEQLDDPAPNPVDEALGLVEQIMPAKKPPSPEDEIDAALDEILNRPSPVPLEHRFWVREGFEATLKLPADLTAEEVDRLVEFVQLLPTLPGPRRA